MLFRSARYNANTTVPQRKIYAPAPGDYSSFTRRAEAKYPPVGTMVLPYDQNPDRGRKRGGHVAHKDEREDRAMVKRMVKPEALTGRKHGGHLTAAQRHKLPAKDFALPGERYPIEDKNHARNALARVSQHGSSEEKARVRAAVHRKYPEIGKK